MVNSTLTSIFGFQVYNSAGTLASSYWSNATGPGGASASIGLGDTLIFTLQFKSFFTMTAAPANVYFVMSDGETAVVNGLASSGSASQMVATLVASTETGTSAVSISSFHIGTGITSVSALLTFIGTTDKTVYTTCLVGGTHVATPRGEVMVEALRRGDLVLTASGEARPVKWVGRTELEGGLLNAYNYLRPITIRAGALGDGLPRRDLKVSPMHGIALDGMLIPAASLVNGVSIIREENDADMTYFHVELDSHDLLVTEGAASESFIEHEGSRVNFDNVAEYYDLYGVEESAAIACLPMVREGYAMEAVRNRLASLAGATLTGRSTTGTLRSNVESVIDGELRGWAYDEDDASRIVEVEVLVDGEVVGRTLANEYRSDLFSAQCGDGSCAFSISLPPSVTSLAAVEVRRVGDGARLYNPASEFSLV